MSRLDEIRARCKKATPGPWRQDVSELPVVPHYYIRHEGVGWPIASMINTHSRVSNGNWRNDIDFITAARQDIPWLIDEIERSTVCFETAVHDYDVLREFHDKAVHLIAKDRDRYKARAEALERAIKEEAACETCIHRAKNGEEEPCFNCYVVCKWEFDESLFSDTKNMAQDIRDKFLDSMGRRSK